jgi:hypothetical protein
MPAPMSADQVLAQLRLWGLEVVEHGNWRTHNRNQAGGWTPVGGVQHHTGSDAPDVNDIGVLIRGTSTPGPLCQFATDDDGRIHMIGWGRANHAGKGTPAVLAVVRSEDYGDYPPRPDSGSVDGNGYFYGNEATYSGKRRPTDQQYAASVRLWAAICHFHGWKAQSVIGHKEWTSRKVDPGNVDMKQMRADIQALLDAGPPGAPTPEPEGDSLMALTDAEQKELLERLRAQALVNQVLLIRTNHIGNVWAPRMGQLVDALVKGDVEQTALIQRELDQIQADVQREGDELQASFAKVNPAT